MKPMRLAKREVTDPEELHGIVERCRTVRIGAIDDEGMFIVPMNYGYEWETAADGTPHLTLWLHGAREGRKAAAFAAGDTGDAGDTGTPVAIELDEELDVITGSYACSYSFSYRSIMGTGRIYPRESGEDKVYGLGLIMAHLAPEAPHAFGPGVLDRTAVWRLEVERFTGKERMPKVPQA